MSGQGASGVQGAPDGWVGGGHGMAGGSSSAAAQSSAARKNSDEGAPARNRRRGVRE